jgi:hypothetical protein
MTESLSLIIFSIIILFIEIYSETHLKNYGRFIERIVYLLSIKTIFNLIKFSVLISFCYALLNLKESPLLYNFIENKVINIDFKNWFFYFVPTGVFSLIVILTNSKELFRQLEDYAIENEILNKIFAHLKYIFFRMISYALTFTIFKYSLQNIIRLHEYFLQKNLHLFDWLNINTSNLDNYNKGVYFSLLLTIIIFFLFNNSFIKRTSGELEYREIKFDFLKYFFITTMLCIGLFFGFFSIFNGLYNLLSSSLTSWISKENILGILPIRISSLLIIVYLLSYIYKEVLDRNIVAFLLIGILPIRSLPYYKGNINFEKRETLFFSQISFYILNIALAEFFIIIGYKSLYLSILNFAILFILDDFKIINDYSQGFRKVLTWHFMRVWLFNIIMMVFAVILLSKIKYYLTLVTYLILTFILFRYYFKNFALVSLRKEL